MKVMRERVSLLFKAGVKKCIDAGCVLEPEDYVWIHEAAKKAIDGTGREVPALLEMPVRVGNVTLYPRTIGAGIWWESYGKKWFGDAPETEVVALAWVLNMGRSPEYFHALTSKSKAMAAFMAWQLRLAWSVTPTELAHGIDMLFDHKDLVQFDSPNERKEADSASSADWGQTIAILCATYHRPPEYFLWEIGEQAALDLLRDAPPPPGCERPSTDDTAEYYEIIRHIISTRAS